MCSGEQKAARGKAKAAAADLRAMKLPEAARKVESGIEKTLTYSDFPTEHWIKIGTNNAIKRSDPQHSRFSAARSDIGRDPSRFQWLSGSG